MNRIREKDWKRLRAMKDEKLAIACDRIFEKIERLIEKKGDASHETYLKLWKTLRTEDRKIGDMFDDLKRSNALQKLTAWYRYKLLSDEELAGFTDETRDTIEFFVNR